MKKLLATVLAITALMAISLSALATPVGVGSYFETQEPGNADRCISGVIPFQQFDMHVVGFNLGNFTGWELSITIGDPTLLILSRTLNPAGAIDVGLGDHNYVVGLGLIANGTPNFTLVTYRCGWFNPTPSVPEITMCIGPAEPSSFNPASPGYSTATDELVPLVLLQTATANYGEGCAVINPAVPGDCATGLSSIPASFGELKARF